MRSIIDSPLRAGLGRASRLRYTHVAIRRKGAARGTPPYAVGI